MPQERSKAVADKEGSGVPGIHSEPAQGGKAESVKRGGGDGWVESDEWVGDQWEGDSDVVVEVPSDEEAEVPSGAAEGRSGGEESPSVVVSDEDADVEEAGVQGSDEIGEKSGAGADGNGAGGGGSAGESVGVEEIPFAVSKGGAQDSGVTRNEGGDSKVGSGGAPASSEEAGAGRQEAGRSEAAAPVAVEPVAEEFRAGLVRIEGKVGALVTLLESQRSGAENGEGGGEAVLAEIKGEIGMQRDVLGSTLKQMQASSELVARTVEESAKRIEASLGNVEVVASVGKGMEHLESALRTYSQDISRRIRLTSGPQRWAVIAAVAIAAPACVVAGAFVEQEWRVLPIEDATGGWKGHIWEIYGRDIMGCVQEAYQDGSSFECVLNVKATVERVEGGVSGR